MNDPCSRNGGDDPLNRGRTLGSVADGHDDLSARAGQAPGEAEAGAVAGAGDNGEFPGQVGYGYVAPYRAWSGRLR